MLAFRCNDNCYGMKQMHKFLVRYKMVVFIIIVLSLILIRVVWVAWSCWNNGHPGDEKKELLERKNYLVGKVIVSPRQLLDEMPAKIGEQFQGEWALYSCSMLAEALTNMARLYPETQGEAKASVDSLIRIVMSEELREYDKQRWDEDPLESLDGIQSHVSYLSHLAWMIGNYRRLGGDDRYNQLHVTLCATMNRRILRSPILNIPTYPGEPVYVPDMMVAIVALSDYAALNDGKYRSTVDHWLQRAKNEWIDPKTGLLASIIYNNGKAAAEVKGSYAALNCYYLTKVDIAFAKEQFELLKTHFCQSFPVGGVKEYHEKSCWLGMDIDAGPIILNLSPSGTAFAIGSATFFGDKSFRNSILKTAEIFGHTVKWGDKRHYLLGNIALVGEAITLAMRTNFRPTD